MVKEYIDIFEEVSHRLIWNMDSPSLSSESLIVEFESRIIENRQPPERPTDEPERQERIQNTDRASFDSSRFESRALTRHRSLPCLTSSGVKHQLTKSNTIPKFPSENNNEPSYDDISIEIELIVAQEKINPLTHDQFGMELADDISYDFINLDYINRLVGEGYPIHIVIRALGISRNDLEIAYDILHEFGWKVHNNC